MRHYRTDSPEAAARIVAACVLSDGHVGIDELEALDRMGMENRLTINRAQLLAVMQQMCEDLATSAYLNWNDACRFDPAVIYLLAQEVRDWRLRREILALCEECAHADGHLSEAEAGFIRVLRSIWRSPDGGGPGHARPMSSVVRPSTA
jgi:uncharacterized tellurite resistance protein B-like protein